MSTTLELRLMFTSSTSASENLENMLGGAGSLLNPVSAECRATLQEGNKHLPSMTWAEAQTHPLFTSSTTRITLTTSIPCWRFASGVPERSALSATFYSWGRDYFAATGRNRNSNGDAALVIDKVGPWVAFPDHLPVASVCNPKVEQNLEELTQLVVGICTVAAPRRAKLFTDSADYAPYNAHMLYFSSQEEINSDLADIQSIEPKRTGSSLELGEWRSAEQRNALDAALRTYVHQDTQLGAEKLSAAWNAGWLDSLDLQNGRLFFDYPHFMNSYVDSFYTRLLSAPG